MKPQIGVVREIKALEKRVALIPQDVLTLTSAGYRVFVESGAGAQSRFADNEYEDAGAEIVFEARDIYQKSDLIVKVKEPQKAEYELLRKGQFVFSFLHLASPAQCELVDVLLNKSITSVAYETLEDEGRLPILKPMSEIAGGLSLRYAMLGRDQMLRAGMDGNNSSALLHSLKTSLEDIGQKYPDIAFPKSGQKVAIYGAGVAGMQAMRDAVKVGCDVLVVDIHSGRKADIEAIGAKFRTLEEIMVEDLLDYDVLIGAAHSKGQRAAIVMSQDYLAAISKSKQKVLMDISIDQGGNFPGSHPTDYHEPFYWDESANLRFCVANVPSFAGPYASRELSKVVIKYLMQMLRTGLNLEEDILFNNAVNTKDGEIMLQSIRDAHKR